MNILDIDFKSNYGPILSKEEELETIINAKNGNEQARKLLIERNIPIIIKILVDDFKISTYNSDFGTLVSLGASGFSRAIDKYDLKFSKHCRFYSYAVLWAKQSIRKYIYENKSKVFKIPISIYNRTFLPIFKCVKHYNETFERNPTIMEIVEYTKLSERSVRNMYSAVVSKIIELDSPIKNQEADTNSEIVDFGYNDFKLIFEKDRIKILTDCINELDERSKFIILNRFGLYGESLTLEVISKKYNLTRERIRQLEVISLKKLKSIMREKGIHEYEDLQI